MLHTIFLCLHVIVQILPAFSVNFFGQEIFSTATPYFWTRDAGPVATDAGMTFTRNTETCQAVYIDFLARHGTRYPKLDLIQEMDKMQERVKTIGPGKRYSFLNQWRNPFTAAMNAELSAIGIYEQTTIGKRFSERFSSLLNTLPSSLEFYASHVKRTKDSAIAFQRGMNENIKMVIKNATVDDIMIRFFDNCNLYSQKVLNNKTALAEVFKFAAGPEMTGFESTVMKQFSSGAFNISIQDVDTMINMCTYEIVNLNTSKWCQLFSEEDMQVYDYYNDLQTYWKNAYGHPLNYEISCPYFSDVFSKMDAAINNFRSHNYTRGVFRFGHAETVSAAFSALGLFHDDLPFLASNYRLETNRQFHASKILPSSSSVTMVLYRCDTSNEFVVKLLVNEQEVIIPACGQTSCPYSVFRDSLQDYADHCQFDNMCHNVPVAGVVG